MSVQSGALHFEAGAGTSPAKPDDEFSMIPRLALAQAAADIYTLSGDWLAQAEPGGVYVALRQDPAGTIVCFRGSVTNEDWTRDFSALPHKHPVLGWCESGFVEGMDDAGAWVAASLPKDTPYAVCGHSLGAARALIASGLLTAAGRPPERILALGCPRPGFRQLSDILLGGGYPIEIYRNGPDPVAEVPLVLPHLPYCKPVADQSLHEVPANPLHLFGWHSIKLYLAGVARLSDSI